MGLLLRLPLLVILAGFAALAMLLVMNYFLG